MPLPSNIPSVVWGVSDLSYQTFYMSSKGQSLPDLSSPGMRHGVKTTAINENSGADICREGKTGQDLLMLGTAHLMSQGPAWRVEEMGHTHNFWAIVFQNEMGFPHCHIMG